MLISSVDIRNQFIEFFKAKKHKLVNSSSVVPNNDPTLLFTNAGMNQFKPYFMGLESPIKKRVVNSQKCIRVSGKHNDLEEVGVDEYHHTFFEMLGNWSFGDYYKKEAICWAWELLVDVWKLDKMRIWVTIFQDDDESGELWKKYTDINHDRILKFGHKDNFWEMGEEGPCGPCTEIHYYTGDNLNDQKALGVNLDAEYREIWNLVFIQYNRDNNGKLHELPEKHVDTGAGFERLVAILNGKSSNYETDLFIPIINKVAELTKKSIKFKNGIPHRVIADHIRMLSFSLSDGAMPGNDGRGYVLRRILRRGARFGRILEMEEPFLYKLVDSLCKIMGDAYPELIEKQKHIEKVIHSEELSFNETLDRGLEVFNKLTNKFLAGDVMKGDDAFKLYDTYGFPLDLTELIARENNFTIDKDRFNECMIEQQVRARNSRNFKQGFHDIDWIIINKDTETNFIGYDKLEVNAKIIKYSQINGKYKVILNTTPFYAESGGQVSDSGFLTTKNFSFKVEDVQMLGNQYVHFGTIEKGNIEKIKNVNAKINIINRQQIRRNHTSTHLLHQAMKDIIGDHVQQAGSLVSHKLLRFDFTHYEKIKNNQIIELEQNVNSVILKNIKLEVEQKQFKTAKQEGAISLFGEKYSDIVRVVNVPGYSKELCGGTHVNRTGDIGFFKIISESALSAGVRRIVAISGESIQLLINENENIINGFKKELKCSKIEMISRVKLLIAEKRRLEKEAIRLKKFSVKDQIDNLMIEPIDLGEVKLFIDRVYDPGDLRDFGDQFREKSKSKSILLIGTIQEENPMILCAVTDDMVNVIHAGNLVQEMGKVMGGGGGGKSHLATAGGNDIALLQEALNHGKKIIESIILKNNV